MANKYNLAEQENILESGNELAAIAAAQINYHVMGYYPITPSTQIAEYLDEMKANGRHTVCMIPGDGEHGAAGICYGATTAGGRVFNATSANGLLFAMEQLPVQAGTRFPMVLNVVNRTVSGPLDIKCDQSDIMMALNTGWIIIMAHTTQMVYDFNIFALKIAERAKLPIIVSSDGFFTSHQKKKIHLFKNDKDVQDFLGKYTPEVTSVEPGKNPVTIGPYMNEDELTGSKLQLSQALEDARAIILDVFEEFASFSGRKYSPIETYKMEDAEVALMLCGSAYETGTLAVDEMRKSNPNLKIGAFAITQIRPFPEKELQKLLANVKVVVVGDRQDSYSGMGGNMSTEIRAALKNDPNNKSSIVSRVYGLGGTEFTLEKAKELFDLGLKELANPGSVVKHSYLEQYMGDPNVQMKPIHEPLTLESQKSGITVTMNEQTHKLEVKTPPLRELTGKAYRYAQGHGACNGCGIFSGINTFMKGIEGEVVLLVHTGCSMVVTTGYPYSSYRTTYVHNLFQNGAATLSGIVEMYHERKRRGEIEGPEDPTFIMVTGDGGHDIGMGPSIGAAIRNHKMIILEYDNEGYMNTGNQLSFSTPLGHRTSTSNVGKAEVGKQFNHKDVAQIFAGCHIPYVATGCEAYAPDLVKKAAKAQWYANHHGTAFVKLLIACPLNWKSPDDMGKDVIKAAVDCCFFPLYEIEHGITTITNMVADDKKQPVTEWLKMMGKTKHLLKHQDILDAFQKEVDRRWYRLKAMHESPLL
ncbi:thiamine pyrophosphate-dependent enzyme [Brachyspira innocens]|uniref:thiamine pyrophosphate-dependent enzyme n=1 Tax=Brachyspira innocens TaxID=13264 RepID=UPI0026F18F77|nr:thiamine pyrophosphate-dependent enzyme [Brachyspira innocens]